MSRRAEWVPLFLVLVVACGNRIAETQPQRDPPGDYSARRGADVGRAQQLYRDGKKEEGAALLRELAADPAWNVRSDAARTIGAVRDPALLPQLHALLADERMEVRESASRVLGWMGDASSVAPLRKALSDQQGIVRGNAAEGLIKAGGVAELEPIGTLLESDDDPNVKARIALALGETIRDPAAVPLLVAALDDESAIVRGEVAQAIGAVGHPSGRAALEKTAESDPDPGVRERAQAALRRLETPSSAGDRNQKPE